MIYNYSELSILSKLIIINLINNFDLNNNLYIFNIIVD